ncbi:caspase, EACC1-associated type [Streptomyces milbemycinicus]|uniref:Caspase family protein n=1 Tax=Streptomyces milbemycinicus TaxID=476552 RepID=A0ABW8M0I1_9ACTN
MHLPDPATSRAVLIGVYDFAHLPPLKSVENNLNRLCDALTDPELWGLPKEHCQVIRQPRYACEVVDAISKAADEAEDTLFIYYAGHGLPDPDAVDPSDQLYLALSESKRTNLHWSLRYRDVRTELLKPRQARRKIVVLDCCHSGHAAAAMGSSGLQEEADIEGTYVLTSSGSNALSFAPPDAELTVFTGELLSLIEGGVPGGPELLTVEDLFQKVKQATLRKNLPTPQKRAHNTADQIPLVRNRAYVPELPPSVLSPGPNPAPSVQLSRADLERLVEIQKEAANSFPYGDLLLDGQRRPLFTEVYVRQQMSAQGMDGEHRAERASDSSRLGDWSKAREREERRVEAGAPASDGKQDRRVSQSLKSVLASPEHLLITGGPGMGKSSLISQLPRELPENAVPIRVTARHLALHAARHEPWQEAVAAAVDDGILPAGLWRLPDRPTPNGQWVILIDALDEVSDLQARSQLVDWVEGVLRPQDLPFRMILTSRPPTQADRHKLIHTAGMVHYTLEPFTADGLERFAKGWFHDAPEPDQAERFLTQLREGHLLDVAKVPLLATIAAIVFEKDPDTPLPKQRFGLYEQFLTHLAEGRSSKRVSEDLRTLLNVLPDGDRLAVQIRYRRSQLGQRLAVAASEGETNLLDHANVWVRELAEELEAPIPETPTWRAILFSLAEYTGLVTRDGDDVRFWHLSFAEHLAAQVHEQELPDEFDPNAEVWSSWLARIFDGAGQEEVARLVLVRHTHSHPDSVLLPWLQQRTDHHQALVGELLLRGAKATDSVLDAFCDGLRRVLFAPENEHYDDMLTTAALLGDPKVSATLASAMRDDSAPTTARVAAAQLLTERSGSTAEAAVEHLWTVIDDPHLTDADRVRGAAAVALTQHPSRDRAAEFLLETARDERVSIAQRRSAAEALASMGGEGLGQAQACLIDLMHSPRAHVQDVVTIAEALAKLSPSSFDETLSALEAMAEDPATSVFDLIDLMRVIAGLDHDRRARSIDMLDTLMTSPRIGAHNRAKAAEALAEVAPDRFQLSVDVLLGLVLNSRLDMDDRIDAAERLARVDADQRADMANELFRLAQSPHCGLTDKVNALVKSASLAPGKRRRCVDLLAATACDTALSLKDRLYAVSRLSGMDPQNTERVVPVLEEALSAPGVHPNDQAEAARHLGKLSDAHRAHAIDILRHRITASVTYPEEATALAKTLAQLAPEQTDEVEAVLMRVVESRFTEPYELRETAELLVSLVPRTRPQVVAALLRHAAEEPETIYMRWMLRAVVSIDPGRHEEVGHILRTRLTAPGESEATRKQIVETLAELGGAQERADAVRVLSACVTDTTTETGVRLDAAESLVSIDPVAVESVAEQLLDIAADETCPARYRIRAAGRIGGLGRAHHKQAKKLLKAIATDERCDMTHRDDAQEELQNLQDIPPPVDPASGAA